MPKDTTPTGQQYSASTPFKLKGFRYLMGYHSRVCKLILNKTNQPYIYIDLNCGAGYQPDYRKFGDQALGSPIIALQELNGQGIEPICHFCDSSQESLEILRRTIEDLKLKCEPHYWSSDNKDALLSISQGLANSQFQGLVYSDPNGKQDFPIKEIKDVFQLPQMRKVDLLMNVATTYVKRWESNPKANWEVYSLEEVITGHGKEKIFVRKPENPALKWTFIYATNWAKQKDLTKIQLYSVDGDVGKGILDHLFNPRFNPLPGIYDDGSVSIQTSLNFDVSNSDLEEKGDES
ncbi:three-Cys-motif partner protein TcmP [Phormidesmis sp. 146-33]